MADIKLVINIIDDESPAQSHSASVIYLVAIRNVFLRNNSLYFGGMLPCMHIILAWRLNLFFLKKNAGTAPFGPAVQMSPSLIAFVSIR